jgi:hypothetical protein
MPVGEWEDIRRETGRLEREEFPRCGGLIKCDRKTEWHGPRACSRKNGKNRKANGVY